MKKLIIIIVFLIFESYQLYTELRYAVWYNVYRLDVKNEKATKEKIDEHFEKFSQLKIDDVFFLVKDHNGLAYYKTSYMKQACEWDVLEYVIKKAKKHNLKIHAYLNVFMEGEDFINQYPEYAELRKNGKKTRWTSPAIKEVRTRILNIIKEIIQNYPIDGIQLDRIRYEGYKDIGYNPKSVSLYLEQYKKSPEPNDNDFYQFKCDLISSFVKEAYQLVKNYNKNIEFSCAVFATPTNSKKNYISQQWDLWVKNGWLDVVYPMAYTSDNKIFKKYLMENLQVISNTSYNVKLIMGIGVYCDGMTSTKLAEQIKLCADAPQVSGVCFFNAYSIFENPKFFEVIKNFKK
ncbi:MAG: family 10 glycosylhydrolase [Endomicrobia bacterium]|nr:family 10 glycosylhydrolase [Endomicrobiia bacterium]